MPNTATAPATLDVGLYRIPVEDDDQQEVCLQLQHRFPGVRYSFEFREVIVAHDIAHDVEGALRLMGTATKGGMFSGQRMTDQEKAMRKAAKTVWVRLRWCQTPVNRRTADMP